MFNQWGIGRGKNITPALISQRDLVMIIGQLETTLSVFSYQKDARQVQLPRYIGGLLQPDSVKSWGRRSADFTTDIHSHWRDLLRGIGGKYPPHYLPTTVRLVI